MSKWVAPPNWPQPSPGWRPPPGWQPDPSWGPAPPDWKFEQNDRRWFARHKILTGLGALFLVGVLGSALGGGGADTVEQDAAPAASSPAAATPSKPVKPATSPKPAAVKAPEKPAETSGQRNAKKAAENYLSFAAFSRAGLIQQLSSDAGDGYSVADATYGVDAQDVDWKEQAYKAAKNYLSFSSFSRQGLIEQLSSAAGDKYTVAEATYGADKALAE